MSTREAVGAELVQRVVSLVEEDAAPLGRAQVADRAEAIVRARQAGLGS